jgi:hypothetical protein
MVPSVGLCCNVLFWKRLSSTRPTYEPSAMCTEVEVEVNLRPTVSRPVCLSVRHPSGTRDQIFFPLEIFYRQLLVCYFVAPSLRRGRVCNLLYSCFWALPEKSLLGRSPAELTTIFYCLMRLPQPGGPGPRIHIPQEQGDPVIPPGTGFSFCRLIRLALRWRYSHPPPHGSQCALHFVPSDNCKLYVWRRVTVPPP